MHGSKSQSVPGPPDRAHSSSQSLRFLVRQPTVLLGVTVQKSELWKFTYPLPFVARHPQKAAHGRQVAVGPNLVLTCEPNPHAWLLTQIRAASKTAEEPVVWTSQSESRSTMVIVPEIGTGRE